MEFLKDLSIIWSLLHTLVLFLLLFEFRYPKKKAMTLTLVTMLPLILINFALFSLVGFNRYSLLMLLTLSLPSAVVFWFLAKYRDGRFFFTFCMVDTTVLEIVYISNILNHYLTPDTYVVMVVIRFLAYPIMEILTYRILRPIFLSVQNHVKRGWGLFGVIGLLFYLAITLLMAYPDTILNRPDQLPALILLFILMPIIYLHIIVTLRRQQQADEQASQDNIMRLQVAGVISRVEELGEANERFREERHNFRHKLKAIASLVETGQYEELAKTVVRYENDIEKTQVIRYCKIPIIDAVLSAYIKQAKRAEIDVSFGFDFPEQFAADENSLATVIANAVENAINACEKLPPEERRMEIKVLCKPQFIIMVRNTFNGEVIFDEEGVPINPHDEDHGFGARSIASFCKSVGGYSQFVAENGVFSVYMHLK